MSDDCNRSRRSGGLRGFEKRFSPTAGSCQRVHSKLRAVPLTKGNVERAPVFVARSFKTISAASPFRSVAMLERVQGGLIGQALSKYGIIGLYTVVVYGIGRFLRLSVTNIRMRIPYEDLPSTRRLDSLCQVRTADRPPLRSGPRRSNSGRGGGWLRPRVASVRSCHGRDLGRADKPPPLSIHLRDRTSTLHARRESSHLRKSSIGPSSISTGCLRSCSNSRNRPTATACDVAPRGLRLSSERGSPTSIAGACPARLSPNDCPSTKNRREPCHALDRFQQPPRHSGANGRNSVPLDKPSLRVRFNVIAPIATLPLTQSPNHSSPGRHAFCHSHRSGSEHAATLPANAALAFCGVR